MESVMYKQQTKEYWIGALDLNIDLEKSMQVKQKS